MGVTDVIILGREHVERLLKGREAAIVQAVRAAYEVHGRGDTVMPHSVFLRFPGRADRIIALPAYLGGMFNVAGMKWIASFAANHALGLERASGVVVLNSMETGLPVAICDASLISAKRTAASAALAARVLHDTPSCPEVGLVGCGVINFETLRFLRLERPDVDHVLVYDVRPERARRFAERCAAEWEDVRVAIASDADAVIGRVSLVSIATTAMRPHIGALRRGAARTVLHLSLRDLDPSVILECANVVDDADHVCRAETSLHLAERLTGNRAFIRSTLADILLSDVPFVRDEVGTVVVFSPFGLGILDLAVAQLVYEGAMAWGAGLRLGGFSAAESG
jgi:2,3-diaminopropionate biosynthesis protein SbnB